MDRDSPGKQTHHERGMSMDYTEEQIIEKAKKNEEILYAGAEDRALYHAIRYTLSQYAAGRINADRAASLRTRYVNEWKQDRKLHAADQELLADTVKRWAEIETLVADYRHNKSIENADRILDRIYGIHKE